MIRSTTQFLVTVAARAVVAMERRNAKSGKKVTYQGIYFQIGDALKLPEDQFEPRVRQILAQRYKCREPGSFPDVIIRDSLNQLAAKIPGNSGPLKPLVKSMFINSYASFTNLAREITERQRLRGAS